MEKNQLVINTLVFLNELKKGLDQSVMMDTVHELGINNIEIRREYIKDFEKEIATIKEKSKLHNMNIFYSVPEWVYKENKLLAHDIEKYFKEAYEMNCHNVKLNIGQYKEVNNEDIQRINELSKKYEVKMTVENDQTSLNGKVQSINQFLCQVKKHKGNITFTFDIGNWFFQDEDPLENAELLNEFVTYIHLKDISKERNNVLLNEGVIEWKKVLDKLPKGLPIAIEYPCETKEKLQLEINKILQD
ncbi:hypothetical protein psyc5s11_51620 [Clostridium gelidum]|uniref:Xylose isomerase-like TIM barrel domain-containing protein n=1 Tax=Clostridium gelidum TaxID=704125 RepID=A0ABM7TDD8_9CLOT|nr:sugar phosphate isomerase/epimerase [Clostridium gelidum]BCZ49095.1 hypothetical protein psyc5s11_51620 [Clostridium gelidum]